MNDDLVTPPRDVGLYRAAIGLAQGLALYFILHAKLVPMANAAILPVVVFVPLLVIQGWRAIAPRTLAIWACVATACILGLSLYAEYRHVPGETQLYGMDAVPEHVWPAFMAGLFVAQALIAAASAEQRAIATYRRYFETASAQAIQVAASVAFTGALWLSLVLGAQLFKLINIKFLDELIGKEWFILPVVTLAVSVALHATDVRPGIIRGIRTLALTLLSWLLPLMTLLALGFVASLPFTGLEALWATRNATAILLVVAGALAVFINAAYQDGSAEQARGVFRLAMPVAALLLVPLCVLAAVAVGLRVGQYGWTNDRVYAAAGIFVASCAALGYGWAVITTLRGKTAWLKPIETTNTVTAFLALGVLVTLLTPIGDPARIGTASQLARLETGRTSPEDFDFKYLRFGAARYGRAALQKLAARADSETGKRATEALAMRFRIERERLPEATVAAQIAVHPAGRSLPASFLTQRWPVPRDLPACVFTVNVACDAMMLDVDQDGRDEILLQPREQPGGRSAILREDSTDGWKVMGYFYSGARCRELTQAIQNGAVRAVPSTISDLEIAGQRVKIYPPSIFIAPCTDGG